MAQFYIFKKIFTSRCLVAASNSRRSPSSGLPNCPHIQLPASNSNNSQRLNRSRQIQSQGHITTDGQSINKSWCRAPSEGAYDQIFITLWQLPSSFLGRPLWRDDRSVFCVCCWPSSAYSSWSPSFFWVVTIFYGLRFETYLLFAFSLSFVI
jgi:hypothetical protein